MNEAIEHRRLRAGIVGGGRGAFIGTVHRIASELDAEALVVAGALSSDPAVADESAKDWRLARSYHSYEDMARAEAAREDGIDFVIIATPNHLHVPVALAFLRAGIHVICDKPLAATMDEASKLVTELKVGDRLFALTHTYAGYPAIQEARARVRAGELGTLRKVHVEYLQDWLISPVEQSGQKQASWRVDPAKAGIGGALGDIGTHAHHLVEYVTGSRVESVCCDAAAFVAGRKLDDDANLLLRLRGRIKGTLVCSQIAAGEENELRLRVYGTKAGLDWRQQEPNTLILKAASGTAQTLRTGRSFQSPEAAHMTRVPAGHPEGYLEAFASIYRAFISDIRRRAQGQAIQHNYPGIQEGVRGLAFVAAAVASSARGSTWVEV